MGRNARFATDYVPLRRCRHLKPNKDAIAGALGLFNPTKAVYDYVGVEELTTAIEGTQYTEGLRAETVLYGTHSRQLGTSEIAYSWSSRNNRKGRHTLVVRQDVSEYITPSSSANWKGVLLGLRRMATNISFRDISLLIGIVFTLGCCVLLVNAGLTFLPYVFQWPLPNGVYYVQGGLSVLSCCLFFVGSTLAYIEAVNDNRQGCFGWKIEQATYSESAEGDVEKGTGMRFVPDEEGCTHHHPGRTNLVVYEQESTDDVIEKESYRATTAVANPNKQSWRLLPSYHEFRTHYLYELGFLANALFACSSFLFSSCSVAALISIVMSNGDIARWIRYPQLLAGSGFFSASTMLMLETQKVWWKPAVKTLGWYISLMNVVGSAGFIFCAIFGILENTHWSKYQFGCSFLWGSSAFLFGSVAQWYEALDKHPIQKMKAKKAKGNKEGGEGKG